MTGPRVAVIGAGMTKFVRRAQETGKELSWQAASAALESCELSLADCFLLAAVGPGDRLATSDRAVLRVADVEGLDAVPIPDGRS